MKLRWVHQEHAEGCAPAAMAMIFGIEYAEACTIIESGPTVQNDGAWDWNTRGSWYGAIERELAVRGWSWQKRYMAWFPDDWPPQPFAPLHYAQVKQPSGNAHFVVMDADGRVLDPLREGDYALSDWEVNQVSGLWEPG